MLCLLRFYAYLILLVIPKILTAQNRYDVVIAEFLSDPTPSAGLPESEFIELKNRSTADYNLHNWNISNGNNSATIKVDYILKADGLLYTLSGKPADKGAYNRLYKTPGESRDDWNDDENDDQNRP